MASDRETRVRVQDLHEREQETDYARMTPAVGDRIELVPLLQAKVLRGFLCGLDTSVDRGSDRL